MFTPTRRLTLDWKAPSRRITFIWPAWVFYGALAGLLADFGACASLGQVDGLVVALCWLVMAPLAVLAGGAGGYVVGRFGWSRVRPALFALAGGVLLGVEGACGWMLGGAVGGLLNGMLRGSRRRSATGAVLGVLVGLVAWAVCAGWLVGVCELIDRLSAE
jgi:hypothetical protein